MEGKKLKVIGPLSSDATSVTDKFYGLSGFVLLSID